MAIESADYKDKLSKATSGLAGRIGEIYTKVCPVDATALVDGACKVCGRQVRPSGPDTSDLSDQEAKQIRFWNRRLQGSATSKDREHALKEIRKIDPEFTPSDTPKTLKESVDKFFTDEVRIGPQRGADRHEETDRDGLTRITHTKEKHDMARHEVTGQAQPQNEGSIPADEADRLPKMPLAPGSRIRPSVENTQSSKSGSVAVKGVPADDGGLPPQMPVPSSSVYTPPPAKVVAASDGLEPSR